MELRAIRQTSHIDGVNRNPGLTEHDKAFVWDNNLGKVKYVLINGLNANSKTSNGYVTKGDDSSAANYIWKLDSSKNPAWRLEEYLASILKIGNSAVFTMNSGGTKTLELGALAWQDSITGAVTSVFGRPGDVLAESGDYTAEQVTNALDKLNDTLDDISEGDIVKRFTADYKAQVDANTLARHTHTNKSELDLITDAGDGVIPTSAQIYEWDNYTAGDAQNVMDTVDSLIQDNTGITWVYDDTLNTLTPTVDLGDFTTDDLPESETKKYYTYANKPVIPISLPGYASVAVRCSNAAGGVDYPTGWTISAGSSEYDLRITHGLNRNFVEAKVWEVNGDLSERLLPPFSAAYTGLLQGSKNEVIIEGLTQDELPLRIELMFD